jgi:alpha-tubulin suppressor-like RCC1 family protein
VRVFRYSLFFALLIALPALAEPQLPARQCATATGAASACPPLAPTQAITTTSYDAVRSDAGPASAPIDVWGKCRYVDNNTTNNTSYFIPFKTDNEWRSFITGAPDALSLVTCAKPATMDLVPSVDCANPSPASQAVDLPYARTGTVLTRSATFTCAGPQADCPSWTQTVRRDYTGLNSDVDTPSWLAGTASYLGSPPDPSTCATSAACGSADGATMTSPPTANLCNSGSANAVSGSGPWNWSCLGANGGSNASCSALRTPCTAYCGLAPVCGTANGISSSTPPGSGLCGTQTAADGAVIGFVSVWRSTPTWGVTTWDWSCISECCGTAVDCSAPVTPEAYDLAAISSGVQHGCGIKSGGTAWCWGKGNFGRLGNGAAASSSVPVQVGTSATGTLWSDWIAIAAGGANTCGIRSNGAAYCWGFGGRNGDGSTIDQTTPRPVSGGATWIKINAGNVTNCGIRSDGTAWCWGSGDNGRRGDGTTAVGAPSATVPVQVGTAATGTVWSDWVDISAGNDETCGVRADGSAWCWGAELFGDLGNGVGGTSGVNRGTPQRVGTAATGTLWSDWVAISAGGAEACGMRSGGSVWCWGAGDSSYGTGYGFSTGDGTFTERSTPVTVSGGGVWTQVSAGGGTKCGITSDGSAWCWSMGVNGQIGNGAGSGKNVPTRVGTAASGTLWSDWVAISVGGFSNPSQVCGIRSNGLGYCWGGGANGMLGNGSTSDRNVPTQISGSGTWNTN